MTIGISIVASIIASAAVTKILAAHYFKIVDGYVKDMCDLTENANERTLGVIERLEGIYVKGGEMKGEVKNNELQD